MSRAPATAEHGGRFAIFANQEGHDFRVGEEYSEIQQSPVRQDADRVPLEDIGPPLPPPRSPPPPGDGDMGSRTPERGSQASIHRAGGHDVGSGSDTESLLAVSEASGDEIPPSVAEPAVEVQPPRAAGREIRAALAALDAVDLPLIFQRRAVVMQSIPFFLRGPFRNAMLMALKLVPEMRSPGRADGNCSCCCKNLLKVGPFQTQIGGKIRSIFPGTVGNIASRERGRS